MLVHRYLRLTPAYAAVVLFTAGLSGHMGDGPMWFGYWENVASCRDWWWTNLLYINNIVPFKRNMYRECDAWTWYLATDMQFFLVGCASNPSVFVVLAPSKFLRAIYAVHL
jgi:peptidoglycan/LPS O-acetylase OafA/YrhL